MFIVHFRTNFSNTGGLITRDYEFFFVVSTKEKVPVPVPLAVTSTDFSWPECDSTGFRIAIVQ